MRSGGWRWWLAWLPPVVVAGVILVAVGGDDEVAPIQPSAPGAATSSTSSTSRPLPLIEREEGPPPELPVTLLDYTVDLPAHFLVNAIPGSSQRAVVELDTTPAGNPTTDAGATLGRVLFYDVDLSRDRTRSCASCHQQSYSFGDQVNKSPGLDGTLRRRNTPSLANAVFNPSGHYLWDEAAESLESHMLEPIFDTFTLGIPPPTLIQRLNGRDFYGPLFTDAFGDPEVTPERVALALAQFVRSLVSDGSRYDEGRAQVGSPLDPFPNFTDEENLGKALFYTPIADGGGSCASCHVSEAQVNNPFGLKNNGIDPPVAVSTASDLGAYELRFDLSQLGSFRVPSLRNVAVSAPYMHDGRLATLADVIDHYNEGVQPHENLGSELRVRGVEAVRLGLTETDELALIAFLNTLTDETFLHDERFANPFPSG